METMIANEPHSARIFARREAALERMRAFEHQGTILVAGVAVANVTIGDFMLAP